MTTKSSPTDTVRAEQGSQPQFGGLRVGIMRVGEHQGRRKAQIVDQRRRHAPARGPGRRRIPAPRGPRHAHPRRRAPSVSRTARRGDPDVPGRRCLGGVASARLWAVAALLASVATLTACEEDTGPDPAPRTRARGGADRRRRAGPADVPPAGGRRGRGRRGRIRARTARRRPRGHLLRRRRWRAASTPPCATSSTRSSVRVTARRGTTCGPPSSRWSNPRASSSPSSSRSPAGTTASTPRPTTAPASRCCSKLGKPSTISLDAPVQGDCDRDGSEPLPPLPG